MASTAATNEVPTHTPSAPARNAAAAATPSEMPPAPSSSMSGQLWRIDRDGKTHLVAEKLGTANGIEVSPDGKTLYVNESVQRNVWAFRIGADGSLSDKRLLKKFEDHGFDGMRCDVDGNLYITRYGKGTVAVLSPEGKVLLLENRDMVFYTDPKNRIIDFNITLTAATEDVTFGDTKEGAFRYPRAP